METGVVGLGRMGANMARRMLAGGHTVAVSNRSRGPIDELANEGARPAHERKELIALLKSPRVVWVVLPAGPVTQQAVDELALLLEPGDVLIDGGNSYYRDSLRRADVLRARGVRFVDCGTSGGIWGRAGGYSLMVGGDREAVDLARPLFDTLAPAPDKGWGHVGPSGSGHFVKMVHNGIEYGLMQAYAEGFSLMRSKSEFGLDLYQVAEIWRFGSVVRSWLLDLAANALQLDPSLASIEPIVADSGEGRWTALEAIQQGVAVPVMSSALNVRLDSQDQWGYAERLLAALRGQFGGHEVPRFEPEAPTQPAGSPGAGVVPGSEATRPASESGGDAASSHPAGDPDPRPS
jgi:6-phosphogluconate dehydrogenase